MHGSANISGLTPAELDVLQLGHIVRNEQQEQHVESARRGRKYSRPERSTSQAMKEFSQRHIQ